MAMKKQEVWTANNIHSFLKLAVSGYVPVPVTMNSLLNPEMQKQRQNAHYCDVLARLKQHAIGLTLYSEKTFNDAIALFLTKLAKESDRDLSAKDEIIFLMQWVFSKNRYMQLKNANSNVTADTRTRAQALTAIKRLQDANRQGLALGSPTDQQQLSALLEKLQNEIKATKRKAYEGKSYAARVALEILAHQLNFSHNISSPAILRHFSDSIGETLDQTTIDRYATAGKKSYEKSLQDARRQEIANLLGKSLQGHP